jgi:hypothetical protein
MDSKETMMRHQAFLRAAAGLLASAALLTGGGVAIAQTSKPEPVTMTDTAPLPATERESLGAVILMDQPVLAQREAMQQAQERSVDTRTMGAGAARVLRDLMTKDELEQQRALDAEKQKLPTK